LEISAPTGRANPRLITSTAPPDRGLSKSRPPIFPRGPQNSSDDEGMPVICPTCQIRRKYWLSNPQAMNDPFISQKVQDIFDRPRFPRVWRALRARTRTASHVENPGNPQESSALHYPDQTGG